MRRVMCFFQLKLRAYPGIRGQASQIITLDRDLITEEVGKVAKRHLELILTGIDIVLGR